MQNEFGIENKSIGDFLEDICKTFPEVRPALAKHDPHMTTERMEAFAACTTKALGEADPARGVAYLTYMSEKLRTATAKQREFIDVYYAEHLFWQASPVAIKQGWKLVPENLKRLYLAFHGRPPASEYKPSKKQRF
jgi:hypothetical protein